MKDYSELRAAAEAAPSGDWRRTSETDPHWMRAVNVAGTHGAIWCGGGGEEAYSIIRHVACASPATIISLLDELDALRAVFKPLKRNDYPPEFDAIWSEYPVERQGTKRTAYKAWAARIKAGIEPNEILLGLRRYLAHAKAIGTETKYLRLASTFFGPDEHFAANYVMPQRGHLGKAGSATASAAQEWLRGQGNG